MNQAVRIEPGARLTLSTWSARQWVAVLVPLAAILLLPAAYNRFPLIFPDTATYVGAAYEHKWPLDRSGFYGLINKPFLLPFDALTGVWLAITFQAAVIAGVVILALRRVLPHASPDAALLLLAAIAITTTLSWHSAQLMPDAYTGPLILSAWLAASRNLDTPGTPLLWVMTGALTLFHYTHLGVVGAGVATCLLVCAVNGTPFREIAKRALAAALVIAAVVSAHVTIHGIYFGRWTVSPMGGHFLFGRLNEDGLVPIWFDRHCGRDAPKPLCDLRPQIPRDSQVLLWGDEQTPFNSRINLTVGKKNTADIGWHWIDMLNQAAVGSIKDEPLLFAKVAMRQTVEQFVSFTALDDECPRECQSKVWFEYRPNLYGPVHASRQLRDEVHRLPIRVVTSIVAVVGLLILIPMFILAIRRRDALAQSLLATVAVTLVANAAMTGALSDVHDRYQSRIVWLAPFAVLLLVLRWRSREPAQS